MTVGPSEADFRKSLGKDAEYIYGVASWSTQMNFIGYLFNDTKEFVDFLVLVNDGSTDSSPMLIPSSENIILLNHPKNLGKGAALKSGSLACIKLGVKVTITLDADYQHDPRLIPQFLSDMVYNVMDHVVLTGLTGLGILFSLIAIFMFKRRDLQLRMGYVVIIISVLLPLVAVLLMYNENTATADTSLINDASGIYLPIVALIFGVLGNRFVKKDDKLVKSMDRLR